MPTMHRHDRLRPEDPNSQSMVLWAIEQHQSTTVQRWMKEHPSDPMGFALLHAVQREETSMLGLMVNAYGLDPQLKRDVNVEVQGGSLLEVACDDQLYQSIQTLIKLGIHKNHQDRAGNTVLHTALQRGHGRLAQTLIAAGVNVNLVNNSGELALHIAVRKQASNTTLRRLINKTTDWYRQSLSNGNTVMLDVLKMGSSNYDPSLFKPLMEQGASEAMGLKNYAGLSAHDELQSRGGAKAFAAEGLVVYEAKMLRHTLEKAALAETMNEGTLQRNADPLVKPAALPQRARVRL